MKNNKKPLIPNANKIEPVSNSNHILIHPEDKGYTYKIFWREDEGDKLELIGSSEKAYRTKRACVNAVKKLKNFFGASILCDYIKTYGSKGEEIDTKLKTRYIF